MSEVVIGMQAEMAESGISFRSTRTFWQQRSGASRYFRSFLRGKAFSIVKITCRKLLSFSLTRKLSSIYPGGLHQEIAAVERVPLACANLFPNGQPVEAWSPSPIFGRLIRNKSRWSQPWVSGLLGQAAYHSGCLGRRRQEETVAITVCP